MKITQLQITVKQKQKGIRLYKTRMISQQFSAYPNGKSEKVKRKKMSGVEASS